MRPNDRFGAMQFWGVAVVLLALVACKKTETNAASEAPDLQMVSAGNAPRTVLRYRIPKGTSQGLEVVADMTLTAGEMGGPLPTIVMTMLVAVEDVGADKRMKLHTTIVDAIAHDREDSKVPAAALTGPLDTMKGIAMESMLSPDGRLAKTQVEGSKQLSEDIARQLTSLSATFENVMMPLPNEPVGVGAVWRASRRIEQNGLKLTAVNTFTLTAIDGDKLTFTIDSDVHGDDQTVKQGDLSVSVKDITGRGNGSGTLMLTKLDMTNDLTAEFRSQMVSPGEEAPTQMKIASVTRIRPSSSTPAAGSAQEPAGSAAGSATGSATGSANGSAAGRAVGSAMDRAGGSADENVGSGSGSGRADE